MSELAQAFYYIFTGIAAIACGLYLFSDRYADASKVYKLTYAIVYAVLLGTILVKVFVTGVVGACVGLNGQALFTGAALCALSIALVLLEPIENL